MSNIRPIDMMFLDDLFGMGSGYVLNFSDRTFVQPTAMPSMAGKPGMKPIP